MTKIVSLRRLRPERSHSLSSRQRQGTAPNQTDFCPMVTPDGKYLFFSRRTGASWQQATEAEIFWVDIGVIDRLRP